VSAGRQWRLTRRVDLSIEGGYTRAGAEDSSAPRNILYVQAVPLFRIGGR
jgi:hypothetical protein